MNIRQHALMSAQAHDVPIEAVVMAHELSNGYDILFYAAICAAVDLQRIQDAIRDNSDPKP